MIEPIRVVTQRLCLNKFDRLNVNQKRHDRAFYWFMAIILSQLSIIILLFCVEGWMQKLLPFISNFKRFVNILFTNLYF